MCKLQIAAELCLHVGHTVQRYLDQFSHPLCDVSAVTYCACVGIKGVSARLQRSIWCQMSPCTYVSVQMRVLHIA